MGAILGAPDPRAQCENPHKIPAVRVAVMATTRADPAYTSTYWTVDEQ